MAGGPRTDVVREGEIAIYHTWSRCALQAHLCGRDPRGVNRDYRRAWMESLLEYLASQFAIDIGNFQVMSNHLHLVSRTRPDIANTWTDEEVAWRWKMVWPKFEGGRWVRSPTDEEIEELLRQPEKVTAARQHLASISWLMGRWKESFSRQRNSEDGSRGTCWEQRFGCREVLEGGLLVGNIYLDLNQFKAGMVECLEQSKHSGIRLRIRAHRAEAEASTLELQHQRWGPDEGGSLELMERLFADCWLAPIGTEGPLKLVREVGSQLVAAPDTSDTILLRTPSAEEEGLNASTASCRDDNAVPSEPASGILTAESSPAVEPPTAGLDIAEPQEAVAVDGTENNVPLPGTARRRRSGRPLTYAIHRRYAKRGRRRASDNPILDISRARYIELVEWAAVELVTKRGQPLPDTLAAELRALGVVPENLLATLEQMDRLHNNAVGPPWALQEHLKRKGRKSLHGIRAWRVGFT